jgi:hypothetical protein
MEIADLYLIICHPDNKNYKRMRLPNLQAEVEEMLACRKRAILEKATTPVVLPLPAPEVCEIDD